MKVRYICEECEDPCYLSFTDREMYFTPRFCPMNMVKVKWLLVSEGEE